MDPFNELMNLALDFCILGCFHLFFYSPCTERGKYYSVFPHHFICVIVQELPEDTTVLGFNTACEANLSSEWLGLNTCLWLRKSTIFTYKEFMSEADSAA